MELSAAPRLSTGDTGLDRCECYLDDLPLPAARRRELRASLSARPHGAMNELHRQLAGARRAGFAPAVTSIGARLAAHGTPQPPARRASSLTTPPLARTPMAPQPWSWPDPFARRRRAPQQAAPRGDSAGDRGLARARVRRRGALLALVVGPTVAATFSMHALLPERSAYGLEAVLLALFALLFAWISAGFWTAAMGFVSLVRGGDRHLISRRTAPEAPIPAAARTAIVMPICNEDVARVFAGLRATYESLAATGDLRHFDFFVLSDSSDADLRVAELAAWQSLCRAVDGFDRIFYRCRRRRVKRKSGNLDDFLRRWGGKYRYMVVLDADSVMSGACLATLVRLMEAHPGAGIIQTAPCTAGRDTLYARMQQFAARVYGPLFTAGLHYWQLDESHYWGHNAIIRVAPFIKHCVLAPLPGHGNLSGPILSHDFVEAALMSRAGYGVWIAYDLEGSWEQSPPNLIEELGRDRRWCHGNLMNLRLAFACGVRPVHRALFLTGAMAYGSGPLWLAFLVVSTVLLAVWSGAVASGVPLALGAPALGAATGLLLFLPKLLAVMLALVRDAAGYGGRARLLASVALEAGLSVLLAPTRMLYHARFVVAALAGWRIEWLSPARADLPTPWRLAWRRHGIHALGAALWLSVAWAIDVHFALWLLPVAGALILSAPTSVWTSSTQLGRAARRAGLFLVPEETRPPRELHRLRALLPRTADAAAADLVAAVVQPGLNALVTASARARACAHEPPRRRHTRASLVSRALSGGPQALDAADRRSLLDDPLALSQLHYLVWTAASAHADWLRAFATRDGGTVTPPPSSAAAAGRTQQRLALAP